jgi:hypothetical protein
MCVRGTQSARGPARGLGGTAVTTVRGTRRRAGQGRTAPPGKAAMIDVTSRGGRTTGSGVVLSPLSPPDHDARSPSLSPSSHPVHTQPQNILGMLQIGSRDLGFGGADWVQELVSGEGG